MIYQSTILLGLSVLPGLISAAIDPNEFNAIALHQQFAAAAYCPGNYLPPGPSNTPITCRTNNCPDVQGANQTIVRKFALTPVYDTSGFVAVDTTHKLIVVAFRGTENCELLAAVPVGNCRAGPDSLITTPVPQFCGQNALCQIGVGWLAAWNEVRDVVVEAVNRTSTANPGFRVLTTGHSLGGALATVAGIDLRARGFTVDLTPFASPRIANDVLARFVSAQDNNAAPNRPRNRRVTHIGDGVNNLPTAISLLFPGLPAYFHFEPSYLIKTGNGPETVTFRDIDRLFGIDLLVPTAPLLTPLGLPDLNGIAETALAHSIYLNPISQCFSGAPPTQVRMITELSIPIKGVIL